MALVPWHSIEETQKYQSLDPATQKRVKDNWLIMTHDALRRRFGAAYKPEKLVAAVGGEEPATALGVANDAIRRGLEVAGIMGPPATNGARPYTAIDMAGHLQPMRPQGAPPSEEERAVALSTSYAQEAAQLYPWATQNVAAENPPLVSEVIERDASGRPVGLKKQRLGESLRRMDWSERLPVWTLFERGVKGLVLLEALERVKQDEPLSDEHRKVLTQYTTALNEQQARGRTWQAAVADIVTNMPQLMVHMAMTGPMAKVPEAAGLKILTNLIEKSGAQGVEKWLLTRTVAALGKTAVRGAARAVIMPTGTIAAAAERQARALTWDESGNPRLSATQESLMESAVKAFATDTIEYGSEEIFEILGAAGVGKSLSAAVGKAIPKTSWARKNARAVIAQTYRAWRRVRPKGTAGEFIRWFWKEAGRGNPFEEWTEERVADLAYALTGIEDYGQGTAASAAQRVMAAAAQAMQPEQLLIEGVAFTIGSPQAATVAVGGVGKAGGLALDAYRNSQYARLRSEKRELSDIAAGVAQAVPPPVPANERMAHPRDRRGDPAMFTALGAASAPAVQAYGSVDLMVPPKQGRTTITTLDGREVETIGALGTRTAAGSTGTRREDPVDVGIQSLAAEVGGDLNSPEDLDALADIAASRALITTEDDPYTPAYWRHVEAEIRADAEDWRNEGAMQRILEDRRDAAAARSAVAQAQPPAQETTNAEEAGTGTEGTGETAAPQGGPPGRLRLRDIAQDRMETPDAPADGQPQEVEAGAQQAKPQIAESQATVVEFPTDQIEVDPDLLPNFKRTADPKTGLIENKRLQGKFRRVGIPAIVVWETRDGRHIVVTGRHKLDLAKRTGEATVPTQILREKDGWTVKHMRVIDAESNILDEQGDVDDYAVYFRQAGQDVTEAEARERGLTSREKGRLGYLLGTFSSADLFSAFLGGRIPAAQAAAIADIGRGDNGLQAAGMKKALQSPRPSAPEIRQFLLALRRFGPTRQASQGDLFGFDDSALRESEAMGKAATARLAEITEDIRILRQAKVRGQALELTPQQARTYRIRNRRNPAQIDRALQSAQEQLARWEHWDTDKELFARVRELAGLTTAMPEAPTPKAEEVPPPEPPPTPPAEPTPSPPPKPEPITVLDKPPPGGWTDADKVPKKPAAPVPDLVLQGQAPEELGTEHQGNATTKHAYEARLRTIVDDPGTWPHWAVTSAKKNLQRSRAGAITDYDKAQAALNAMLSAVGAERNRLLADSDILTQGDMFDNTPKNLFDAAAQAKAKPWDMTYLEVRAELIRLESAPADQWRSSPVVRELYPDAPVGRVDYTSLSRRYREMVARHEVKPAATAPREIEGIPIPTDLDPVQFKDGFTAAMDGLAPLQSIPADIGPDLPRRSWMAGYRAAQDNGKAKQQNVSVRKPTPPSVAPTPVETPTPAAPTQVETPTPEGAEDDQKEPKWKEGQRVVVALTGDRYQEVRGRHGIITDASTLTMQGMFGLGAREYSHYYEVRTDSGATAMGLKDTDLTLEDPAKPLPTAVPDPELGQRPITPQALLNEIANSKSRAYQARATAARARSTAGRLKAKAIAAAAATEAARRQQKFDDWAARYPEAAAPFLSKAQPAAPAEQTTQEETKDAPTGTSIVEAYNDKKQAPVWVVNFNAHLPRDQFLAMKANAKKHGGYYSRLRGGKAIAGFQFESQAQAQAFAAEATEAPPGTDQASAPTVTPPASPAPTPKPTPQPVQGPTPEPAAPVKTITPAQRPVLEKLIASLEEGMAVVFAQYPGPSAVPDLGWFTQFGDPLHLGYGLFETELPDGQKLTWDAGGAMHRQEDVTWTPVRGAVQEAGYPFAETIAAIRADLGAGNQEQSAPPAPKSEADIDIEMTDELAKALGDLDAALSQQNFAMSAETSAERTAAILQAGTRVAVVLIKMGVRKFKRFAQTLRAKAPQLWEQAKPYLHSLWSAAVSTQPADIQAACDDISRREAAEIVAEIESETQAAPQPALVPPAPEASAADDQPQVDDSADGDAIHRIEQRLRLGNKLTRGDINDIVKETHAGGLASGKVDAKHLTDLVEAATNRYILSSAYHRSTDTLHVNSAMAEGPITLVQRLKELVNDRLPTQTTRTDESEQLQQFSTPPFLGFVANWVADVVPQDTMLEPSAGIGGLAVFAKARGARVIANELSPRRAQLLRLTNTTDEVTTHNAEHLHALLWPEIQSGRLQRPTVVVMNPPFSHAATTTRSSTQVGAQHLEQALELLSPGGRLVAIVGEGMGADKPRFRAWWDRIARQYTVRANIGISGSEYRKFGTSFGNQIVVIDKTGQTKNPESIVTGGVEKVEDLIPLLLEIRNDRPALETAPTQPGGRQPSQSPGSREPASRPGPVSPGGVRGGRGVRGEQHGGNEGGAASGAGVPGDVQVPGQQPGPDGAGTAEHGPEGAREGDSVPPAAPTGPGLTVGLQDDGREIETIGDDGIFAVYSPAKVRIPGAQPHPTELVESSVMASVPPVTPSYSPKIPQNIVTSGALSEAQLEQVVYAGQAHAQLLPSGERQGYFIGDGTGVGKGRIIAGAILDNWNQGRKKAVWITKSNGLIKDAIRDVTALGMPKDRVVALGRKPKALRKGQAGIGFLAYDTLAKNNPGLADTGGLKPSTKLNRMQILLDWLGPDFDGVIALDEIHRAGNAVSLRGTFGTTQPSQRALAVVDLQKLFPKARILYLSATGATDVTNLGYADRLGIWGPGRPFSNKAKFFEKISAGGLSAMEIVSRDLKAMGVYLARTLSFRGVESTSLVHELTPDQHRMYDELAKGWAGVFANIDEALGHSGSNNSPTARRAAMSAFWGAQQRFYNQLMTALQMPTVLTAVQKDLDEGRSVVLQIVNTNEATLDRELGEQDADSPDLEGLDLTPRKILQAYVDQCFPTTLHAPVEDADGNIRWQPVMDANGNPVKDPHAVELKQQTLAKIGLLRVPDNPLEMFLDHFGADKVAEVTGRSKRVVWGVDEHGARKRIQERRTEAKRNLEVKDFEDGKRRILVFSDAGGTGFSYHAGVRFKNQQRRVHYVLQAGWRADGALQGMGRTHRSDQVVPPIYKLVSTNLKGHQRFISTVAKRLGQLGALTSGERAAAGSGVFSEEQNLENKYSPQAIYGLFLDAFHGRGQWNAMELSRLLGFVKTRMGANGEQQLVSTLVDPRTGALSVDQLPNVTRFLNRILSTPVDAQNALFSEFTRRMEEAIEVAKTNGTYDSGVRVRKSVGIIRVKADDEVHRTDTGAVTRLVDVEVDEQRELYSWDEVDEYDRKQSPGDEYRWVKNRQSGHVYAIWEGPTKTKSNGSVVDTYWRIGPASYATIERSEIRIKSPTGATGNYERLTKAEAKRLWTEQHAKEPTVHTLHETYIVGAFLPVWDRINIPSPSIYHLTTDKGSFLGAYVAPDLIAGLRARMGAGKGKALTAGQVWSGLLAGQSFDLANGWQLKRSRVLGEQRIEVVGIEWDQLKEWTNFLGGYIETIGWDRRAFVPMDEKAGMAVLEKTLQRAPVVEPTAGPKYRSAASTAPQVSTMLAEARAAERLRARALWRRTFGTDNISFVDRLFAGGADRLGRWKDQWATIVEGRGTAEDTTLHEAVHAAAELFLDEHDTRRLVEAAGRTSRETATEEEWHAATEAFAEGIVAYAKARAEGRNVVAALRAGNIPLAVRRLVGRLYDALARLFHVDATSGKTGLDEVMGFYENLLQGYYKRQGQVVQGIQDAPPVTNDEADSIASAASPAQYRTPGQHDDINLAQRILDKLAGVPLRDKGAKPDLSQWRRYLMTIAHYADRVPGLQRLYHAALALDEDKHRYGEQLFGPNETLLRELRQWVSDNAAPSQEKVQPYLWKQDRDARGPFVKQNGKTWEVYGDNAQQVDVADDEDRAWIAAHAWEYRDLMAHGWSSGEARAIALVRIMNDAQYRMLLGRVRETREAFERLGLPMPQITDAGGHEIDLFAALDEMGSRRGYYMPRIRPPGRWQLYASRKGENPRMEVFTTRAGRAIRARALQRQGWALTARESDRPSEEAYLDTSPAALQDFVNNALRRMDDTSAARKLSTWDLAVTTEIYKRKDGKDEPHLVVSSPRRFSKAFREIAKLYAGYPDKEANTWRFPNPSPDLEQKLAKGMWTVLGGVEEQPLEKFAQHLASVLAGIIHSRGSRARKIGRSEETGPGVWEGYETDAVRAVALAGRATAGGTAKADMARRMLQAMTGTTESWEDFRDRTAKDYSDDKLAQWQAWEAQVERERIDSAKQPNAYADALSYMRHMLANESHAEQIVGMLRGIAAVWQMSGPASALVNMTSLVTSVPAIMHEAGIPAHRIPGAMVSGIKDYAHWIRAINAGNEHPGLPEDQALQEMHSQGWDTALMQREALEAMSGRPGRAWTKAGNLALLAFSVTERLNRGSTLLASYRELRRLGKSHDEAMTLTRQITGRAHGEYGKPNLHIVGRGGSPAAAIGRSWYMYKTFTHNYLVQMGKLGVTDRPAALWMMLAPAILGGLGAAYLPDIFVKLVAEVVGKARGEPPPDDPEEWFAEQAYEMFGETGEQLARTGVTGTVGIDLRPNLESRIADWIPHTIQDLLGAPAGLAMNLVDAVKLVTRGAPLRAIEKVLPRFASGAARAAREATQGVTNWGGAPIFFGDEPLKPTATETALRAVGFGPARISDATRRQWRERKFARDYDNRRSDIYARYRAMRRDGTHDSNWADIKADIDEYNRDAAASGIPGVAKITSATLKGIGYRIRRAPSRETQRARSRR